MTMTKFKVGDIVRVKDEFKDVTFIGDTTENCDIISVNEENDRYLIQSDNYKGVLFVPYVAKEEWLELVAKNKSEKILYQYHGRAEHMPKRLRKYFESENITFAENEFVDVSEWVEIELTNRWLDKENGTK